MPILFQPYTAPPMMGEIPEHEFQINELFSFSCERCKNLGLPEPLEPPSPFPDAHL